MDLTSGVDVIEIERIQRAIERHGERFLKRIFTPLELEEAGKSTASLAARFSAKEAVAKALGCGIGPVSWLEIEIRRGPANRPELFLSGAAARLAEEQGLKHWTISLSHSQQHAVALAVALRVD
jgi:holo-[acyl-carrier protein] synthase